MHDITTRHSYVKINNSFVHLVQYGNGDRVIKSSTESPTSSIKSRNQSPIGSDSRRTFVESSKFDSKRLVVFVPGNPGLLGVYHDYLVLLYKTICHKAESVEPSTSNTSTNINNNDNNNNSHHHSNSDPILLAIGHNNFDHPEDGFEHIKADDRITIEEGDMNFIEQSIAKSNEPNSVEMQVLNKLIILKHILKYNLEDCQLVFVGHSVGCYIILKLLQDGLVASVHQGSIMIHPALENLSSTDRGSYFDGIFNLKLDYLLRSVAYLAEIFLPRSSRISLTKKYACSPELVETSSQIVVESFSQLCCSNALNAMISMAKSEFSTIKNIDHNLLIKPFVERLRLIYSKGDHWVNEDNRKELLKLYPKLYIEEQPTMHAFIMEPKTVIDYAIKVGTFIQEFFEQN